MASVKPLVGKVCIVTGATRGIGKGIALQLGAAGATVYITGRTLKRREGDPIGGSLEETAEEITNRGGTCIPVQCDHSKDEDIKALFDRVNREQEGQLDLLVNNAYSGIKAIADSLMKPFWEQPPEIWDEMNIVGLRNHYICSVLAARMMVPRKQGLIVNVSSTGGLTYLFNVAYGIGKEGCDRMAADCGKELRKHNVAFVSLWPGLARTETVKEHFGQRNLGDSPDPAWDQQDDIKVILAELIGQPKMNKGHPVRVNRGGQRRIKVILAEGNAVAKDVIVKPK